MGGLLIIGATGLVGQAMLATRGNRRPTLLVRRAPGDAGDLPVDIAPETADWPARIAAIAPETLVCALGTTRRAAGSEAAFRAVDQHLVLASATAARAAGARHMICVTSVGASSASANLYLNAKGLVEDGLDAMGFDRLDLLHPGLLIGPRTERRPAEAMMQAAAPLFDGLLMGGFRRYRSISVEALAKAIWALTDETAPGRFVHEHDALMALANLPPPSSS